jgi:hypothetical protein
MQIVGRAREAAFEFVALRHVETHGMGGALD